MQGSKGVVLVIALMVLVGLLILTGAYYTSLMTEKKSADSEQFVAQCLNLAEAGAQQGQSELRERIRTDLLARVNDERRASVFTAYITSNDSLGFLRDFAYAAGDAQFTITGSLGVLNISALNLNTGVKGNYSARIIVEANGAATNPQPEVYIFPYKYMIESRGTITQITPATQKTIRLVQGNFTVTVRRDTFAKFALFTNHHRTPGGTTVWFTANTNFTGPLHTNERFSFANNPSGTFTEPVTQHLTTARFYNNGWPRLLNADNNAPYDVPSFQQGFRRGSDLINLPSSLTQQDLKRQATGDQNDAPWSNGIYLPNEGGSLVGGIYIKGNASSLRMNVDESNRPVYTVAQGANTKEITIDYSNNQTIVANVAGTGGTPAGTYNGIPDGISNEGIILYANGRINNFSGTVQSDTQLTVSSDRDIVINNHVLYQSYHAGSTPDATGYTNLLGILTWNGNVRISTSAPYDLNIHGIVMAAGRNGIFTVDNYQYGSPRGTVTLLGGAITDFYGPFGTFSGTRQISGYGRNFVYDARMLQGTAPPYFPYISNFFSFDDGGLDNRPIWQDKGV